MDDWNGFINDGWEGISNGGGGGFCNDESDFDWYYGC